MRTRYGIRDNKIVQISALHGRRVVTSLGPSYQRVSVSRFEGWLALTKVTQVMGEYDEDFYILDPSTLKQVFSLSFDRDDRFGLDSDGRLVFGRYFPRKDHRYRAWDTRTWEEVDGYAGPAGKLEPLGTRSLGKLVRLADASPFGEWQYEIRLTGRTVSGSVVAEPDRVTISAIRGEKVSTRKLVGEAVVDGNRATWYGEYGGEEHVSVVIEALNDAEAEFRWRDGVTYDENHTLTR